VSTSAQRVAQHRRRAREGSTVVQHLEVTVDNIESLVAAGVLQPWRTDDPAEIARAIARLLDHLARE
jgi:hypothetical protein